MLPIGLTQDARQDLAATWAWYEDQKLGLGDRFVEQCDHLFDRIRQMPELYELVHRSQVRRAKLRRFPYVVYYRLRGDDIEILAIIHGHRKASEWRRRLSDE